MPACPTGDTISSRILFHRVISVHSDIIGRWIESLIGDSHSPRRIFDSIHAVPIRFPILPSAIRDTVEFEQFFAFCYTRIEFFSIDNHYYWQERPRVIFRGILDLLTGREGGEEGEAGGAAYLK